MLLEVSNIDTYYGISHVLQNISLSVGEGEVVALLGRNGVGKTTTLRSIIGLTPPKRGAITFLGKEVSGLPAYRIAHQGVGYMPDDLRIFPDLTADENLEIAPRLSKRTGYWNRDRVVELFPKLGDLGKARGINLSGGKKKMLGIGRALMANPRLDFIGRTFRGPGAADRGQPGGGPGRDSPTGCHHFVGRPEPKILPQGLPPGLHHRKRDDPVRRKDGRDLEQRGSHPQVPGRLILGCHWKLSGLGPEFEGDGAGLVTTKI